MKHTEEFKQRLIARNKQGLSEESKGKIRQSLLGNIPWNKGLTKETDSRIISTLGCFKKGRVSWNKGMILKEEFGKAVSEGHKKHIAEKGYWLDSKFYKQREDKLKGKRCMSEKVKQQHSERMLKDNPLKLDPKFGFQKGSANPMFGKLPPHLVGDRNPMKNPEIVKRILEKRQETWMKNITRKPTKPEKQLRNLLNFLFPKEYKYVGDYQFWIDGKNPDFVNVNGQKKIIEMFGNYWHDGKEEQDRIEHFKKFGFDTLIVWENEFENLLKLNMKLQRFHNS